ncbi:MAG: NACHT domain-containing protein [Chitinophagaceae bacterium]|nr:NACHT domain-containing protein [Chitinophagaceae bacterium]
MDELIIQSIVNKFIEKLEEKATTLFSGLEKEGRHFLKTGLRKYLNEQRIKYSHIKTLLRGNTPAYLYEVYYPLKLSCSGKTIETNNLDLIFNKSNYITIIGDAGSGKSTLVKHLFLSSIHTDFAIPILIELRSLNTGTVSLEEHVKRIISESTIASESDSILDRLLKQGKFIFFLDGYDELKGEMKPRVLASFKSFTEKYGQNKFILTSRPYSDAENFQLFHNYHMKKLSLEEGDIAGFVNKQLLAEKELAEKILESIGRGQAEHIRSFLTNPLLLSLYILTFQSYAEVPEKKYIFYRRVIQALFAEHDSKTKLGFVRERVSGMNQEQFENLLKVFCFLSYFENRPSWDHDYICQKFKLIKEKKTLEFDNTKTIIDLKSAIALWTEDNGLYAFAHRSLQEYFAALFICELTDAEKERAYRKIIERFSSPRSASETENFLSLLKEMDKLQFLKSYYLPLLPELRQIVDRPTLVARGKAMCNFLINHGVEYKTSPALKEQDGIRLMVRDEVYKTIYIHLPFTQKLYNVMESVLMRQKVYQALGVKGSKSEMRIVEDPVPSQRSQTEIISRAQGKKIKLDFENNPKLWKLVRAPAIRIAEEFTLFIKNEIEASEGFIKHQKNLDRELVDML